MYIVYKLSYFDCRPSIYHFECVTFQNKQDPSNEDYAKLQDKINQIYTPVPDMPEREISKGLLCIAKYKDNWIRALVSPKPYNENHYFSVH